MRPQHVLTSFRGGLPLAVLLLTGLFACSETGPSAPDEVTPELETPRAALAIFECTARLSGSVDCAIEGGAAAAPAGIVVGGQGTYLQLTSSNVSYDQFGEVFQFDVTVQNLLNEAIGTPNGAAPDPEGIRVFFLNGPTATTGEGTVSVANADGTGTFTAADQPFFRYGQILSKGQVSNAKTWQLAVPSTVDEFTFTLAVDTDVQYLLVINELLANPGGTISDANGEFVEIYNAGTLSVEMQNLLVADSSASGRRPFHLISSPFELEPGGYYVLGNTTNTTNNGGIPVDYAYGSAMAFANSLDAFMISRAVGGDTLTIDRIQYASAVISAQNGISRELIHPSLDNSDMDDENWADASVTSVYGPGGRGTPGAQNSANVPVAPPLR